MSIEEAAGNDLLLMHDEAVSMRVVTSLMKMFHKASNGDEECERAVGYIVHFIMKDLTTDPHFKKSVESVVINVLQSLQTYRSITKSGETIYSNSHTGL